MPNIFNRLIKIIRWVECQTSQKAKWGIFFASVMVYIALYLLLHLKIGENVASFSLIPVITAGLLFGIRGGFFSSILVIALNFGFWFIQGNASLFGQLVGRSIAGSVSLIGIGLIIGLFRKMSLLLENELILRKKTDLEVKTSEQRYRAIIDRQTDIICRFSTDLTINFINDAFCKFFGRDKKDLLGTNLLLLYPEEDRSTIQEHYIFLLRAPQEITMEQRIIRGDGSIRWLQRIDQPLIDNLNNVQEFQSVGRDISKEVIERSILTLQYNLATDLSSTKNLQSSLEVVLKNIISLQDIDSAGIFLFDENKRELALVASEGIPSEVLRISERLSIFSQEGKLLSSPHPQYISPDSLKNIPGNEIRKKYYHSMAVIPINHNDQLVASLVASSNIQDSIPEATRFVLESVAAQLGGAITRVKAEEALLNSEENLFSLVNTIEDMVFVFGLDRTILKINTAVTEKLGYLESDLVGNTIDVLRTSQKDQILDVFSKAIRGELKNIEYQVSSKSGELITVETVFSNGTWGNHAALIGISRDMTAHIRTRKAEREQRILAEALQDTAALLTSSLNFTEIIERILDNVGKVVPHDAANIMLLEEGRTRVIAYNGYREMGVEEDIKKASYDVHEIPTFSKMYFEKVPSIISNTQNHPSWKVNLESTMVKSYIGAPIIARDKVIGFINLDSFSPDFFTTIHAARLKTFADQAGVAIEKAQLYEEIQQLAITDDLTSVLNRRGLFSQGSHETERSLRFNRPLCALMLDIDRFKLVNDQYSHAAGDQILKLLAGKCRKCIREVDILGRYGGEEFVILLLECEVDKAQKIAERIRGTIESTIFQTTQGEISITISIGVAAMEPEIKDFEELVSLADQALYQAKQKGRNCVVMA